MDRRSDQIHIDVDLPTQEGTKGPDEGWWPEDQDHSQRPGESSSTGDDSREVKGPDPAVWGSNA